ncbi:MAG: hypothetical protein ACRC35_04430 [Angustibacter sp.]
MAWQNVLVRVGRQVARSIARDLVGQRRGPRRHRTGSSSGSGSGNSGSSSDGGGSSGGGGRSSAPLDLRYPGDFTGRSTVRYRPIADGLPDPGEVVWAWVPYEEDHRQ